MRPEANTQAGFTLLEAIVAMTLLVLVGGTLLAWLNSSFKTLERIDATAQRIEATRTAMAYLQMINPMVTPKGEVQLGRYRLDWDSAPLTRVLPSVGRTTGTPEIHDTALYRVDAVIRGVEGMPPLPLTMELAGHRVARQWDGD